MSQVVVVEGTAWKTDPFSCFIVFQQPLDLCGRGEEREERREGGRERGRGREGEKEGKGKGKRGERGKQGGGEQSETQIKTQIRFSLPHCKHVKMSTRLANRCNVQLSYAWHMQSQSY